MTPDATVDVRAGACPAALPPSDYPRNPWRPASKGACSSADAAAVRALRDDVTEAELLDALTPTCRRCVASDEADEAWGNIVRIGDHYAADLTRCFALAGADATCTRESRRITWCVADVCRGCAAADFYGCAERAIATSGACAGVLASFQNACGAYHAVDCRSHEEQVFAGCR